MLYSAHITITNQHNGLLAYMQPHAVQRERSRVSVTEDPEVVRVIVEAADATAFRASMNTITQAFSVFETAKEIK